MTGVLAGAALLVGLALGSFANVPIHRWPSGGSVSEPKRSYCPACGQGLRARDNVPVVSWLLLRGRCRDCQAPIAVRYPAVEALTALLFIVTAMRYADDLAVLPALLALTWSLVVASAIDLEHRIIPNRLTYPLPAVLLVLLIGAAYVDGQWADLSRGAVFAVVLPGGMLLISELFRRVRGVAGIGMGDVKLAVSLGLVLGYLGGAQVVAFLYLSIIAAVTVALVLMATGNAKMASRLPFGPYLAIGAMAAILGGDDLAALVLRLFGV